MNFLLFILLCWVGAELNAPLLWVIGLMVWLLCKVSSGK